MAENTSQVTIVDGSVDFSGGVNSIKTTTIQSERNPNGLSRNELAWLNNAGVRDGGILQRTGWQLLGTIHDRTGFYNGGFMYDPDSANPYLILCISGQTYRVLLDPTLTGGNPFSITNLTASFLGTTMPAAEPFYNFSQGENFLVLQAGDLVTLPLFWNGTTLRRSKGITNPAVPPGTPGVNEIPPAGPMDYYMGRSWYAQGRQYSAGDMVGGPSGTAANHFRDAILNVTENPLVLGGDGFTVPTNAGNIRALTHNANLNAQLGQGQLLIGSRKAWYSLQVPVSRSDWINASSNNQPVQTVVQLINGPISDRSIVKANGDIFHQSLEPAIRSIFASVRNFEQWGNISISANEQRVLSFVDRSVQRFCSGILFDNRMLQGTLPLQTPQGVVSQAIIPMDFVPISSFGAARQPVWQGIMQGLQILQMFIGDFGGRERAFALAVSTIDSSIQLWEITDFLRTDINDSGEARVSWIIEFPAFTWGDEFMLKKLVSAELWIDKLYGTVDFTLEWRPDSDPCWKLWHKWKECSARNSAEDCANPISYPLVINRETFRATRTMPRPPEQCESITGRPAHIGYQIQPRLTIHGWCRVRGLLLHAEKFLEKLYHNPPHC
jgi:hypothetical protein